MADATKPTPRKRGAQKAPENETAAERFKRVATPRINNAVKTIGLLEAVANKSVYDYNDDQKRIILDNLRGAVQRVEDAFAGKVAPAGGVTL